MRGAAIFTRVGWRGISEGGWDHGVIGEPEGSAIWRSVCLAVFFSLKKEHRRVATMQITLIFSFNLKLGENRLLKS